MKTVTAAWRGRTWDLRHSLGPVCGTEGSESWGWLPDFYTARTVTECPTDHGRESGGRGWGERNGFRSRMVNLRGCFSLALRPLEQPGGDVCSSKRGLRWSRRLNITTGCDRTVGGRGWGQQNEQGRGLVGGSLRNTGVQGGQHPKGGQEARPQRQEDTQREQSSLRRE